MVVGKASLAVWAKVLAARVRLSNRRSFVYRVFPALALLVVLAACTPADPAAEAAAGIAVSLGLLILLFELLPGGTSTWCFSLVCTSY